MKSRLTIAVMIVLLVFSFIYISRVNVNYDLEEYLPEESIITEGLTVYEAEFGETSYASLVFNETSISETLAIKDTIETINNVEDVIYLDDYLNETTIALLTQDLAPAEKAYIDNLISDSLASGLTYQEAVIGLIPYLPVETVVELQTFIDSFVSDEEMYLMIVFNKSSSSFEVEESINDIETVMEVNNYEYYMSGNAISSIFVKNTIENEVLIVTLICVPLVLLVLLFASKSYFDIVLFGIVVGVSIIISLGTNVFLPNISFITRSMAIALQLAISLDYVVFYLGIYHRMRAKEDNVDKALTETKKLATKPIIASALTTAVSFIALIFMRFSIGFDIGIVFAKAIIISLVCTLTLLPILIKAFVKTIAKTTKKRKPIFTGYITRKLYKIKYVFLVLVICILGLSIYFQTKNTYTYGSSSFAGAEGSEYYEDLSHIESSFGKTNTVQLLIPKSDVLESEIYQDLIALDYVEQINAGIYYKMITTDPNLISQLTAGLYSDNYALITFNMDSDIEGEEAFMYYEELVGILEDNNTSDYYILGETAVAYHIKDTVEIDYDIVMIIALVSIMIIIFFTFKNLLLPVLLPLVIETSVLFTMGLLHFLNPNIVFLAGLVVSAILLGVTIDYAILLSKGYMSERASFNKEESIKKALANTAPSITTSALLFAIAGSSISFISSIQTIKQIGLILAIGALVSLFYVLVVLPQLLSIFDKWIIKSKVKMQQITINSKKTK